MAIRFFDMFAGIGGFRSGLEAVGGFECIGHCEIDPYPNKAYNAIFDTRGEYYCDDARKINPAEMPDFDLVCAGFPCQSFSVAGKRLGFEDTRGTLFFEVAQLLKAKRPAFFLLENVFGLLSHDGGRTLETIFSALVEVGYHFEWCVHNSRYFGVPQQRRRLYIVGYLDPRCAGKVFPLFGSGGKALIQMLPGPQGSRVYDSAGVACTQTAGAGGKGGKTGLYFIDLSTVDPRVTDQARCITAHYAKGPISNRRGEHSGVLLIREDTKKGYKAAYPGDTVSLGFPGTLHRGRVGHDIAHTLDTGAHQGVVMRSGWIRKLMPRECFRLQGFTDEQIDRVLAITSDAQAYKQAGNGVTVSVIEAIGRRIREMDEELKSEAIA